MSKKSFSTVRRILNDQEPDLHGIKLSSIVKVAPGELQPNPKNSELFREESSEYFQKLRDDVQERGILVPLIAKQNGMLIAGHNRYAVAQELGLGVIPVQYVMQDLSEKEEQLFVINDNLLRRHLSSDERIALYRKMYPNFDERIKQRSKWTNSRGGTSASAAHDSSMRDAVPPASSSRSVSAMRDTVPPLTSEEIARDTGQSKEAVKKQLQRFEQQERLKAEARNEGHEVNGEEYGVPGKRSKKKEVIKFSMKTSDKKTKPVVTPLSRLTQQLEQRFNTGNEEKQVRILKELKLLLKKLD